MVKTLLLMLPLLAQVNPVEKKIVDYLRENVQPGKPVVVSQLYNDVFKDPEERKALNRMFSTFFKVPLFMVQFQKSANRVPTLQEISEQFSFTVPGQADIILKIMESDPRMPKFLERNATTGEITRLDTDKITSDARFGRALERTITGWEGKIAPAFSIQTYDAKPLASQDMAGKPYMVYVWFTNCPPCVKTSPILTELHKKYSARGFQIVAANADRFLDLPYDDAMRADYVKKVGMTFTMAHLNKEMQEAYGGVSVFPTMFFVDKSGAIVKHFVNFQEKTVLEGAINEVLK